MQDKEEESMAEKTWNIVVDSGCDLEELHTSDETIGFYRVPLKIITKDFEFSDDKNADVPELFDRLRASRSSSSSACPAPQEWADAFVGADYTLAFTLTGGLSGSFNSALTAKQMVEEDFPEKKIWILDSLSAGPQISLLVYKASELIRSGLSFEAVCQALTAYHERTRLLFVLKDLDTLVKNGRVDRMTAAMVGMLKIRLVGNASEQGTLEVIEKCRGFKKAVSQVLASLANMGFRDGRLILAHSLNEKEAMVLARAIHVSYPQSHISMMKASGLCSYYAGEGGILIGFESQK